jgi:outer membrane protein assembly factor BamA
MALRSRQVLFANYELRLLKRLNSIPLHPWDISPIFPEDGNLSWISFGWYGSNARRYINSISYTDGLSGTLSLRLSHPNIGSSVQVTEVRFGMRAYLPVAREWRHVLAFGLQGGLALGDRRRRTIFSVGGLPMSDPIEDAYFGYRYGGLYLRGYPSNAFSGWLYALGSVEYRLPIFEIEKGILTLPVYLRRLHACAFVDVGGASPNGIDTNIAKVGVGGELRLDMLLGYYLPMTLRLGYGRGLSEGGTNNFFLTMGSGF